MYSITLTLESSQIGFNLINKNFKHFLIHQFNPNYHSDWFTTSIDSKNFTLKNAVIRNLSFDLWTDIETVKKITELNTSYINIYQFEKKISDSLIIENLEESKRDTILKQNGLKHKYYFNHEYLTVFSFDKDYITSIETNSSLKPFIL